MTPTAEVEGFFRHEYGNLIAVLCRRFGVKHLEAIEDAVQSALLAALHSWTTRGNPEQPSAWLFRVANNELLGTLRKQSGHRRILEANPTIESTVSAEEVFFPGEIEDNLLRMLFVCCDDNIPDESRLVLALKTLCGFSIREIALRLFISEANVYKRFSRARLRLRQSETLVEDFSSEVVQARLPAVHEVLYLLFSEGHFSYHSEQAIRIEMIDEAIRLAELLARHSPSQTPETFALLALMHLHAARMAARRDRSGHFILLDEQDRSLWDQRQIQVGLEWLSCSARGEHISRYHLEAAIAAEHCMAPTLEETRWDKIVEGYQLLERMSSSPVHRLNRAVAVAEWQGPEAGLDVLQNCEPSEWLSHSYLWAAVIADLYQRVGQTDEANHFHALAIDQAPTPAIRTALRRRLSRNSS